MVNSSVKPVKRPCKPPSTPNTVYNQSGDPGTRCVLIPLGSPTRCPKQLYRPRRPYCAWPALTVVTRTEAWLGGYTGWVIRVGIPVYYPATLPRGAAQKHPAKRAPEPCRAEWVGCGQRGLRWAGRLLGTTLRARSVPAAPPCTQDPQNAHLRPKRRDLTSFY